MHVYLYIYIIFLFTVMDHVRDSFSLKSEESRWNKLEDDWPSELLSKTGD